MSKPLSLGCLLLLTTALSAPAAFAQTSAGSAPAAPTSAAPPAADRPQDSTPPAEEQVDISTTGGDIGADIVVTGRFIPEPVRATAEVISVLSSADIARSGDGDVSEALNRVTGLSVVGNGYVYVRGLGDRYSLALLNGLPLPSPEPLKRVVPLDIFPTSVLASELVQKSYSANYPGEFGGGVINLTTKSQPEEGFVTLSASVGANLETTGKLGYTYYGSKSDWTGFDSGARDIPQPLKAALNSGNVISEGANFSPAQLKTIGTSLLNSATSVVQRNGNIPANFSAEISGGDTYDLGGADLGLIVSAGYRNGWQTRDAIQQFSNSTDLAIGNDYRSVLTQNRIVVNGLLGLGLEFDKNKIRWTNLYIRDTVKQAKLSRGTDLIASSDDIENLKQDTAWYERQLIATQLVGEFKFGDLGLDLRGTYANSQREAPYERSFTYAFTRQDGINDFVNDLRSVNQNARISFSDLNEDVFGAGIDLSYRLPTSIPVSITGGYAFNDTKRSSSRRDFRFLPSGSLNLAVAQQRPDYLLSDYNIQTYNILLTETSGQSGAAAFDAALQVHAGYGQIEAELVDGLRVTGGVRYEDGDQSVTPTNLFNSNDLTFLQPTRITNSYWLPAGTITWNFKEDMQLRASASKTIARPQFRELARQLYQDVDADRQFFGNPFLQDSKLFNVEARYEWYFGRGERFSLGGFYKKIDKPIETFAFIPSGSLTASFANAPKATLYGAELEVQKFVPLDTLSDSKAFASRRLVLIGNYTYSESEIKVGANDKIILPFGEFGEVRNASDYFDDGAPLTGQSKHLVNLQLGFEDTDRLSQQTILLTYASKRVTNRGPENQPDIFEKPGIKLDVVLREGFEFYGRELELKLEGRNLTNTKFQEYQTNGTNRIDVNTYKLGRAFTFGASYKF
ncbi:MAG: TonB-dependent receptor [Sphingobium sp.]